jgi:acyl-CoA reductase-like NAD-dependent aldehyde dehydrogenase
MEAAETRRAIEAAKAAWPEWRRKTAKERYTPPQMASPDDGECG